jgi:hypothetical protein
MVRTKRKTKRTAPDSLILITESKAQAFKDSLYSNVTRQTSVLTGCYVNWFEAQINDARSNTAPTPKAKKHDDDAELQAWERAAQLFKEYAPIALAELMGEIADQISLEFANVDKLTAADVPTNLRNLDLFELMEHID